jgi:hypothetical protein
MSSRSRTHVVRLAVGATGVVLALAGCSGGGKNTPAASSTPAASASASAAPASGGQAGGGAAFAQYQDCLRAHGAPVPSFSPGTRRPGSGAPTGTFSRPPGGFGGSRGPGGFGLNGDASANPTFAAAIEACASVRPSGGFGGAGGGRTLSAATLAAFASCMSDNGVPVTGTDAQTVLRGLNRGDAKTAAALKVCQPIIGQAFGQQQAAPAASGSPLPSSAPAAPSS